MDVSVVDPTTPMGKSGSMRTATALIVFSACAPQAAAPHFSLENQTLSVEVEAIVDGPLGHGARNEKCTVAVPTKNLPQTIRSTVPYVANWGPCQADAVLVNPSAERSVHAHVQCDGRVVDVAHLEHRADSDTVLAYPRTPGPPMILGRAAPVARGTGRCVSE